MAGEPEKINVNEANLEVLKSLPGMSEMAAGKVIAYRGRHGALMNVEHFCQVAGLSPEAADDLRGRIVVRYDGYEGYLPKG
jgi:competence protein ComEA